MALDPITITINGVEYVCTKKEPVEESKENPFECTPGDRYYHITATGCVCFYSWSGSREDKNFAKIANACKDEKLMKQRALHEALERLLWRASIQAEELENEWDNNKNTHYEIIYDYQKRDYCVEPHWVCKSTSIYFPSQESARAAIDDIVKPFVAEHSDFVW